MNTVTGQRSVVSHHWWRGAILRAVLAAPIVAVAASVLVFPQRTFDAEVLWGGAQALLRGQSPHSGYFLSPLYTAVYLVPLGLLPPPHAFNAFTWMNAGLWLATFWLAVASCAPRLSLLDRLLATGILWISPPVVWGMPGQVVSLVALGLVAFLSFQQRFPLLGGLLLCLPLAKPHLGVIPGLVCLALAAKKGRSSLGFASGFLALTAATLILQPNWPIEWFGQLRNIPLRLIEEWRSYTPSVGYFLGLWLPSSYGFVAGWATNAVASLLLLPWLWFVSHHDDDVPLAWASGLTAAYWVLPHFQGYDLALLTLALPVLVSRGWALAGWSKAVAILCAVGCYAFPWITGTTSWPQASLFMMPLLASTGFLTVYRGRRKAGPRGRLPARRLYDSTGWREAADLHREARPG